MFESLERRIEQPEVRPEQESEMREPIADGLAVLGNERSRVLGEIARISRNPESPAEQKQLRALKIRKALVTLGLGFLKKVQEEGLTALDL